MALAQWWQRLVALLLDGLILAIPSYLLLFVVIGAPVVLSSNPDTGQLTASRSFSASFWIASVFLLVCQFGYFTFLNGSPSGQTVGKKVMNIAVRDGETGGPIGHSRALLRIFLMFVFSIACGLPLLLDALWPLWAERRQSWHDMPAGSVVVSVG